jgi:putative membrane protein insertion efficiency factor
VNVVRSIATAPLRFYRRFLSRLKPPMCRFSPTCSQYAIEAVEMHGVVRGTGLAMWRIARCHPLCKGGYDPVPPLRSKRARSDSARSISPSTQPRSIDAEDHDRVDV